MTRPARRPRRSAPRQARFAFLERAERLDRAFRRAILAATGLVALALIAGSPAGRHAARGVIAHARLLAYRAVGLPRPRAEIDAGWARRRARDVETASATFRLVHDEATPDVRKLMDYAGMGRDSALLRWGNFDRILVLPSAVFEPDDAGRSYRLRPNLRSVWLRGVDLNRHMNGFFLVPDGPGLPEAMAGTNASILPGSVQTTNSWGCRGPEPDPTAPIRGIVLGDSTMQGYFIGDDVTPPAFLGREVEERLGERASILNTGVLGYSPEQYYSSLIAFVERFRPQFVVVALCCNDFGDPAGAALGRGDWDEARYWLGKIEDVCRTRGVLQVTAPVPYDMQVTGLRLSGYYPGKVINLVHSSGLFDCFPIEELCNEFLRLRAEGERSGRPFPANPLYNLHLDDHHFTPRGAEVWGRAVGRRVALLLDLARIRAGKP